MIKRVITVLFLLFVIYADKVKDYRFINKVVQFSIKENINMYKEIQSYIKELEKKYKDDDDFFKILEAKSLYSRRSNIQAKKLILSLPPTSKYYYDANYDLYELSISTNDQKGVNEAVKNIFRTALPRKYFKKFKYKNIKKLAEQYAGYLTQEGEEKKLVKFKKWLAKNNISIIGASDFAERLRHWEGILKEVNGYEDKYLGIYDIKRKKIAPEDKTLILSRIRDWEAEERKNEDLITLLVLMEIARAKVVIEQYRTAERMIADNFVQLRALHTTDFAKNQDLSPLYAARYVLGLCYLFSASQASNNINSVSKENKLKIKKNIASFLLGGTRKLKNGAAQNFYFILRDYVMNPFYKKKKGRVSFYTWKAFDRYEYATRPKVKKWLDKEIPSLVTSKTYGLININRLFQQKRYKQLLADAQKLFDGGKYSKTEKLEVYKDIMRSYIFQGKFDKFYELADDLEKRYSSEEEKKELAQTYGYIAKIANKEKTIASKAGDNKLSKEYVDLFDNVVTRALKLNKTSPIIAELIYLSGINKYLIYRDNEAFNKAKRKEAALKALKMFEVIISSYPQYSLYTQVIYLVATIYEDLTNDYRDNKILFPKYEMAQLKYYKLYLAKTTTNDIFRLKRIYSAYGILSIIVTNKKMDLFAKEGFVYYANQIRKNLEDLSLFEQKDVKNLKKLRDNVYLDEKSAYEFRLKLLQNQINSLEKKLADAKVDDYVILDKKINQIKAKQMVYLQRLAFIIQKALDDGLYQTEQDKVLYQLAKYYDRLNKKEVAEETYNLLSKKFPNSELSKSIVYREVLSLINVKNTKEAVKKFNALRTKLPEQADETIKTLFDHFYRVNRPKKQSQEDYQVMIQAALFCAKTRLKNALQSEKKDLNLQSHLRYDIAKCLVILKNYSSALSELQAVVKAEQAIYYQALQLLAKVYVLQNKPTKAFDTYTLLYEAASSVDIAKEVNLHTDLSPIEKKVRIQEFEDYFFILKLSSLTEVIKFSYKLKKYKKALFNISKLEGQITTSQEDVKAFLEIATAIKILATYELYPQHDLLEAVKQFGVLYPKSKWLNKVRGILN